jgi:hypothetical protein
MHFLFRGCIFKKKIARSKRHLKAEEGKPSREEPTALLCLVHSFEFIVVRAEIRRQIF